MVKQAVCLVAVVVVTVLARGVDGQVSTELVPGESAGGVRAKPVSDIQALHEITSLADVVVARSAKKAGDPASIAALEAGSQTVRFRQGGPCVFFSDQADFESFAEAAGAVLTGLETFEESILLPSGVSKVDDPLAPGVSQSTGHGVSIP